MSAPFRPGDPGLAADRTTLAWRRTGVSVLVIGLSVARGIPVDDRIPGRPLIGLVIVGLGALSFAVSSLAAARRAAHAGTDRPGAGVVDLLPVTASTVVVALGAIAVVLLR